MKKILFVFLVLLIIKPCYSQYIVTKVIGNVKKRSTGEFLKLGSKLDKNDKLDFSSNNDMVRVIEAGSGISIFKPSTNAEKKGNDLMEIVRFTLHVKSNNGNLSGRSESPVLVPDVLETDASVNSKNLISKENKYLFDKAVYDVSSGNKFFLQTEMSGGDPVIKALQTMDDTLLLKLSDFKKPGSANASKAKYSLGFFTKESNSSKLLIQLNPYFDSTGIMEAIMKIIISTDKKTSKEKLKDECYAEVYEDWGKPSTILFKDTFDKIFTYFSVVNKK